MSSIILTNWTVYYSDDAGAGAGYKQLKWTGAGAADTNTNTVNELYSAVADLFSISTQNDATDTTPLQAVTPSVYNIGAFDAGDLNPWFIDPDSIEHLTGGSLSTTGWTRDLPGDGTGSIGIIMVQCSSSGFNITSSDIGASCTHEDGDSGVILHIDSTNYQIWIRPDDNTLGNDFNSAGGGDIEATISTNTVTTSAIGVTGERVWANIYSIGSIYSSSALYITQDFTKYTSWWDTNHLDRLFLTSDSFASGLIDDGLLTTFGREYGYLYDHFQADVSSGGRNPVPLATSSDVNNATSQATIDALTGITFTFGGTLEDINNGNSDRPYDVTINCGSNSISDFYEYTKNVTRRTSATSLNGHDGEQYLGTGEIIINLATVTVALTETNTITGGTSGATGVLVASHTSPTNFLIVRDVRGTFQDSENITDEGSGDVDTAVSSALETITLSKTAPFGTFAGGSFYGARGVHIHSMAGGDANNYSLIDSTNTTQAPPSSIAITVNKIVAGDRVSVFRATTTDSNNIHTTYLESDASANTIGLSAYTVDSSTTIPTDTPSTGKIRLVDSSTNLEHRIRYASWSGLVFTLITAITGSTTSTGDNNTINNSGASFLSANILAGDIVRNSTDTSWAHIVSIDSNIKITTTPLVGGGDNTWESGDGYSFHTLPITYENATNVDTAYVPYIDETATSTSASTSVIYASADRPVTVRIRKKGIKPFITTGTLDSSGYSVDAIRITDTIAV